MIPVQPVTQLPTGYTSALSVSGQVDRFGGRVAPAVAAVAILTNPISTPRSVSRFESKTTNTPEVSGIIDIAKTAEATNREDLLAIARIRMLRTYVNGWSGPESVAPNSNTIKEAEIFARYLFGIGPIVSPYISASADGEVNFYWKTRDWMIDLGFFGDGIYSYYARFENGHEILEDGADLNQPLPQEVIELIGKTT
jgi:hypothetical protein